MSADREETFLTVAEVADWLKLNQQTVRNWIDQGSLPAVRVGRRVRIRRSDLERVLAEGYSGSGTGSAARSSPGPSAEDFWSGEAIGTAEPPPLRAFDSDSDSDPGTASRTDAADGAGDGDDDQGLEADLWAGSMTADDDRR